MIEALLAAAGPLLGGSGGGLGRLLGGTKVKQNVNSNLSTQLGISIQNVVGRGKTGNIDTPQSLQPSAYTVPEQSYQIPVIGGGPIEDPITLKKKIEGQPNLAGYTPILALGAIAFAMFFFSKGSK